MTPEALDIARRLQHGSLAIGGGHIGGDGDHIDAMRVVIRERVEGDGGEIGSELKKGLEQSVEKFKARK